MIAESVRDAQNMRPKEIRQINASTNTASRGEIFLKKIHRKIITFSAFSPQIRFAGRSGFVGGGHVVE